MRRQFLKQLMMSVAAVALLGAQPEIEPEKPEKDWQEGWEVIGTDAELKLNGVKMNYTMALAC